MPAQYKINGKEVTREQWDLIDSANSRMVLCTPCYALVLNEDSILKSEGLYYYDYPNGKKAENVDIQVPGERHIWINKNPRQEGLWIYYDKEGNVIDRKVYKLKKQKAINFGKYLLYRRLKMDD